MNEPEEDLDVDEGIDPSELADLLADAAEDPPQPGTESEGNDVNVANGDVVEENNNQLQSEEIIQNVVSYTHSLTLLIT